jgi:ABC-type uncharacterized transport system substrate-binding protein
MRFFQETALWAALKRLALGLGLIALFSLILLFSDEGSSLARRGLACLGVGLHSAGLAAGELGGRVLLGANPKDLPLEEVAIEEIAVSRGNAAQLGLTIPPEFSQNLRP